MFKEAIKSTLTGVVMVLLMISCGRSVNDKAEELYNEAELLNSQKKYEESLVMLDSIDHAYAAAVDVRRKAMQLRPRVQEQLTSLQLQTADSIAAVDAFRLDSLSKQTLLVQNAVENYFVDRGEGHVDVSAVPGLHPRMAPDGRFYMVATSPRSVNATLIAVSSGGESANTPSIAFDGERNDHVGGRDVLTFIEGDCQEVGEFILRHRNDPINVTFSGNNSVTIPLDDVQRQAVANLFETSTLIRERKKQELEKQRLEKLLTVIRSQIARTTQDTSETAK